MWLQQNIINAFEKSSRITFILVMVFVLCNEKSTQNLQYTLFTSKCDAGWLAQQLRANVFSGKNRVQVSIPTSGDSDPHAAPTPQNLAPSLFCHRHMHTCSHTPTQTSTHRDSNRNRMTIFFYWRYSFLIQYILTLFPLLLLLQVAPHLSSHLDLLPFCHPLDNQAWQNKI